MKRVVHCVGWFFHDPIVPRSVYDFGKLEMWRLESDWKNKSSFGIGPKNGGDIYWNVNPSTKNQWAFRNLVHPDQDFWIPPQKIHTHRQWQEL